MAKVHTLEIYAHTGDTACLGCFEAPPAEEGDGAEAAEPAGGARTRPSAAASARSGAPPPSPAIPAPASVLMDARFVPEPIVEGRPIQLVATTRNIPLGTQARFDVSVLDGDSFAIERTPIGATAGRGVVSASWTFTFPRTTASGRTRGSGASSARVAKVWFSVTAAAASAQSDLLEVRRLDWVRVRIADDETGDAVAGVVLHLRGPDGRTREAVSDTDGAIQLEEVPAGAWDVSSDLARACEGVVHQFVAAGGAAAAGGPLVSSPTPPAPVHRGGWPIVNVLSHKVSTGETLGSIAQANGLTWTDVALFNFGTDVPAEISEHLRRDVGCTKKTADGKNYRFDDTDEPGLLFVPLAWSAHALASGEEHLIRVRRFVRADRVVFRGRVLWVDGVGLENAPISLRSPEGALLAEATTGAGGNFCIAGRHPDDSVVELRAELPADDEMAPAGDGAGPADEVGWSDDGGDGGHGEDAGEEVDFDAIDLGELSGSGEGA